MYLAKYLGKAGFGKFNLAFAYLLFFAVIIDFGLDQVVVRELSSQRHDRARLLGSAIILKMFMAVAAITLLIVLLPVFHYPQSTRVLILLAAASLIFSLQSPSFGTVFTTVFTAELDRLYVTLIDGLVRLSVSAAVLVIAVSGRPLTEIVAVNAYGLMPGFLVMAYLSWTRIRPDLNLDLPMLWLLLKEAAPIAFASIFVMVYFRIDVILLSLWKTEAAIGDYASAYKLTEAFTILGGAVITTILPVASRLYADASAALSHAYEISLKYLTIVMIPVGVGVFWFSGQIIKLFYPDGDYHSAFALSVLVWAEMFILWNMVLNTFLISMNRQRIALYITLGLVVVNVSLNAFLIPVLSFNGSAIATLATELTFTLAAALYLYRSEGLRWPPTFGRLLLANVAFALILWPVAGYSVLLVAPISVPIYVVLLWGGGVITDRDRALWRMLRAKGA